MTRTEQQDHDKRYRDWLSVYLDEVDHRTQHWGDKRKQSTGPTNVGELDINLFEPGR